MLPHFDRITDPIAVDRWECKRNGSWFTAEVQIGRPVPADLDWCCPVFVETFTNRVVTIMGVGPVDAMFNAVAFVRGFADSLEEWAPQANRGEG